MYTQSGRNSQAINMDLLKEAFAYTEQLSSFNATADEEMELELMVSKEEKAFNSVKQSRGSGSLSGGYIGIYIHVYTCLFQSTLQRTYICMYSYTAPDRTTRSNKIVAAYNNNNNGYGSASSVRQVSGNKQKKSMVKKLRNQTNINPNTFDAGK